MSDMKSQAALFQTKAVNSTKKLGVLVAVKNPVFKLEIIGDECSRRDQEGENKNK